METVHPGKAHERENLETPPIHVIKENERSLYCLFSAYGGLFVLVTVLGTSCIIHKIDYRLESGCAAYAYGIEQTSGN